MNTATILRIEGTHGIVCSPAMRLVVEQVQRVARTDAAVLITGETGSGKEVIARAIHQQSPRCNKAWVDINCGALPEHLVESELFGYEKGAFSGAETTKPGLFELANEGTLFFDEIADLDSKLQVKLLRVLDGVPYYRLGGSRKVSVNVRILAATNRPLEYEVRTGRFRKDLFHRLSQIQLQIPPLRERPEDILALAQHFLEQEHPQARFAPDALAALQAYGWPGNVRELRNVIVHLAALGESYEIRASQLPEAVRAPLGEGVTVNGKNGLHDLGDLEKKTILRALAECGGHQGRAAQQLGISRRTLLRKLKLYRSVTEGAENLVGALRSQSFRVTLEIPVTIVSDHGQMEASSVNLSVGGMGLQGISNAFQLAGGMKLQFRLPGDEEQVEVGAQVMWADVHGKAGIKFTQLLPETEARLESWIRQQQTELFEA